MFYCKGFDTFTHSKIGLSHPLRIGHGYRAMLPPPLPSATQNKVVPSAPAMLPQWPRRDNTHHGSGLKVFTPGQAHASQTANIPDFLATYPLKPGYQEAHKKYHEMRNFFAHRAYSSGNMELVIVKVVMKCLKPGYKNPSIVSVRNARYLIDLS